MMNYNFPQKSNSPNVEYPIGKITKIHISSLTPKTFFEQYQKASLPVIITGLLDVISPWTLDYLCEHLGNQAFPVRYYGRSRYDQDKRQWRSFGSGVETQIMPFSQYAEMLRNGEAYEQDNYLGHCSLKNTPLEKDLVYLEETEQQLGLKVAATYFNFWIGLGGHTTCLHYDPFDVTLTQFQGAKKLILFPPSQLYNLYPVPIIKQLGHGLKMRASYSQIYPESPDFKEFPNFKKAIEYRQDCIINPGEMIFIPGRDGGMK